MTFQEMPAKWKLVINGRSEELTLQQIFDLRTACDQVLEHRSKSVNDIIDFVCLKMSVERHRTLSKSRMEHEAMARFCMWHILRRRGISPSEIGRQFHRTHGAVLCGLHRLKKKLQEPNWKERLSWLNEVK